MRRCLQEGLSPSTRTVLHRGFSAERYLFSGIPPVRKRKSPQDGPQTSTCSLDHSGFPVLVSDAPAPAQGGRGFTRMEATRPRAMLTQNSAAGATALYRRQEAPSLMLAVPSIVTAVLLLRPSKPGWPRITRQSYAPFFMPSFGLRVAGPTNDHYRL